MDVDSQKWRDYANRASWMRRWLYDLEAMRVAQLERRLGQRADCLLVVSEAEAELLRRSAPDASVEVVPNGVDLGYFPAGDAVGAGCVFVGALDYFPNVDGARWFCQEVWPRVRQQRPEEQLRLVGRQPTETVRQLGKLPGVEVVGQVPDVRPYVTAAAVVVAPLRLARGVQNKVLEGLAMGRPVVASPQAMQGLPDPAIPVRVADTPQQWADTLLDLLANPADCRHLGQLGRCYVQQHHAWEACLARLDRCLVAVDSPRQSPKNSCPAVGSAGFFVS
jgi:sugar transferase (PEP-CTERM/EpsH1 system associated)